MRDLDNFDNPFAYSEVLIELQKKYNRSIDLQSILNHN